MSQLPPDISQQLHFTLIVTMETYASWKTYTWRKNYCAFASTLFNRLETREDDGESVLNLKYMSHFLYNSF
jgi:hypothetical protein